jgi:hypothetical protein
MVLQDGWIKRVSSRNYNKWGNPSREVGFAWETLIAFCIKERKKGGRHISSSSNRGLLGVVEEQGLIDLNYSCSTFTWSNKRVG